MKKYIFIIFTQLLLLTLNTSCIEEVYPTTVLTIEQISESETAVEALLDGAIAYMDAYYYNSQLSGLGYPMMLIFRDVATHDFPISRISYDYFNNPFGSTGGLGNSAQMQTIWMYYYYLINNVHNVISAANVENASPAMKNYLGVAYVFRSLAYFDMARSYEYFPTGVPALDNQALENEVAGLTVPIVTETITENEARNNPRAPFYHMYRFILNDLNDAETLLEGYIRPAKNYPDESVVFGMKARFWLEMGTRFEKSPADLNTFLAHENDENLAHLDKLGVTSALECYQKSAEYARKAIDKSGCTPLTQEQWYDTTKGFNNVNSQNSWMFSIMINSDALGSATYVNWIANMSPETTFGTINQRYTTFRMIGKNLYDQIPDSDWRKQTWVDPSDAGKNPTPEKYKTLLSAADWAKSVAYTEFKFRPGEGNMTNHKVGAAVDIPLMRMEEMLLIEAEALAHTQGLAVGISKLEDFVNTYRYTDKSYSCDALDMDNFISHVVLQKRIELWGEGIVFFDYKRLKMQVLRGYSGTNYIVGQRFNSIPGYVAPWMNYYITDYEFTRNLGIKPNPDASKAIDEWQQ
ncbi:hypothetical protein M2137_000307 [Parabacteroides sp. PFB2-10]|uniref:RagB/SusD family nutrient uptake outer membrane protein n=1 Tax=Parabacteroides sp. PFB2-10 TaxID=1742405 RepID=UPI002475895E|nr:RagB/SusD family nutrient uptake outer membrane protein [Parabacteroides sp. PFB2-10]MDH6311557.1 hypothetical protein [Parabacteroides sp. PFB2-10]MDL2243976.1 RagB/SusD family nutrient uptake outer membrane protein [Parabacteroides sp. OttesenSCG-928-J18]